jgi:hypothetical protein
VERRVHSRASCPRISITARAPGGSRPAVATRGRRAGQVCADQGALRSPVSPRGELPRRGLWLGRRRVRVRHAGVAEAHPLPSKVLITIGGCGGGRLPRSSYGRVTNDVLVRYRNSMWGARVADNPTTFPAVVLPHKDAELGMADGTVCDLGIRLPPRQNDFWESSLCDGRGDRPRRAHTRRGPESKGGQWGRRGRRRRPAAWCAGYGNAHAAGACPLR